MPTVTRILAPIDWSEPSMAACRFACSLAREHDAELLVLYVVPLATMMYGPAPESYLEHMREELCCVRPRDRRTRYRHLLVEGDAASQILKVARENQCDLIVMGMHGRTGLERALMGSVAEAVVRQASCPVLTVKTNVAANLLGQAEEQQEAVTDQKRFQTEHAPPIVAARDREGHVPQAMPGSGILSS